MDKLKGALDGLRVLDLTQVLAGPFCTMMLADHGAEVIKIEPPQGDSARRFPPFPQSDQSHEFGGYFQSINRNKKSVVLDLKSEQGKADFRRLVVDADILVENYRAGVMEKLGLGYESLARINPRLVYGAIRGFGDPRSGESPYNEWPAYDVVSQDVGGLMAITGPAADQPMKVGPGVGDLVPAMMMSFGLLAAVRHVERTGEGQFVDIAMVDGVLALCERILHQYSYGGDVAVPEGNGHPLFCPFGMFQAKDGWVTIACPTDAFWAKLCAAMGSPELANAPEFASNRQRQINSAETLATVNRWAAALTRQELAQRLGGIVPFGPVNDVTDILGDSHFQLRNMLVELDHPGATGRYTVAGTPVKLSVTPGGVHQPAPMLGQHTGEILGALKSEGL